MDIRMIDTLEGGEISVNGGEPKIDNGLDTAVYISLYTDFNWWGGDIGSRIYQVKKNSREERLKLKEYIKESLNWMTTDGLASKITVELYKILQNGAFYDIIIEQPNIEQNIVYRYSLNWDSQKASIERISNYGN